MSLWNKLTQIGLDLKMGEDLRADTPSFFQADLYLISQYNKQPLPFPQTKLNIWQQQKPEKKPCGLLNFWPL